MTEPDDDKTPMVRVDRDRPCPLCRAATVVDLIAVPEAGDVEPWTVDGTRSCTECDWTEEVDW